MAVLPLPDWRGVADDAARVVRDVDAWASSAALARIVAADGGDVGTRRGDDRLARLDDFSIRWDRRAGGERDGVSQARLDLSERLHAAVTEEAPVLGLAGRETPARRAYDAVVMTGGMVRAGIVKPRFVRGLLDGGLEAGEVVFLGAFRPFSAEESRLARLLGITGDDEWDAMVGGVRAAFDLGEAVVQRGVGRREARWRAEPAPVRVVAAPSSNARRRADTADTFRAWGRAQPRGMSVLVVTTPVYVPYQAAVAVEVLGLECGHSVETVGVSPVASDLGELTQPFTTAHHLQELRSAIGAMRRLRARATARA